MLADDQFVLKPRSGENLKDESLENEFLEDDYLTLVGCQPVNRCGGYALEARFNNSITNRNPPTLWLYFDGNEITWPQAPVPGYAPQRFMWWNDTAYRLLLRHSRQRTHIVLSQCVCHESPHGLKTALTRSREEHRSRPIMLDDAHPDEGHISTRRPELYETQLLLNDRFAVVIVEPQGLFFLVTFEERSL
jgi:hypothetical protein